MKVLGITGGVGSGKSRVTDCLKEDYHAAVCRMDDVARELQQRGTQCYEEIVRNFGCGILAPDGEIDRGKLGEVVFSDPAKLALLNRIVHPAVLKKVRDDIREKASRSVELYALEAALLPDVGGELCDEIWYIYAAEEVRRARLADSRGYTDDKITRMIKSQPAEETFRQASTVTIDNSRSFEDTKRQIGERLEL